MTGLVIAMCRAAWANDDRKGGENGKIAFSSSRSGSFVIWTINPDGTGATQITRHDASTEDWWPVWSRAADRIALTRQDHPSRGRPNRRST